MKVSFEVSAKAARLIGRENIADVDGALVELIKNAYDADATCVYVGFFVLGHYLYNYQLSNVLKRFIFLMALLSAILVILLTHWHSHYIGEPSEVFYHTSHNLFILFESMAIFLIINQMNVPLNYSSIIVRLSNLTLGVYLIHMLLYRMAYYIFGINTLSSFNPYFFIPCYSLIIFAASCLVVFLLKKIPIIKKFIM